ncbi:MAG: hypothetical protein U9P14_12515, partial [Gemmatimonadota bacterium]|nr:hypothetical protein [Gemmatimonadota bacterium]
PIEVVPQYRAVASARERMDEIIHNANAYANDLLPRSRGRAEEAILKAGAFADEKILEAGGKAGVFKLKNRNFTRYGAANRERLRWQAVEKAFKGKPIYILPGNAKRRIFTSDIKPEETRE